MTESEKDAERVAMQMYRHRMAKHENICYEDVKTAYIKGCEDTRAKSKKQRNKRIDELQKKNNDLENKLANVSYQLEGRDIELKELQEENQRLSTLVAKYMQGEE